VTDTNKAVQTLALDIVSRIATGMGKPFEKQTRFFVLPVATVLADQKAPIRAAAVQTLTAMATACDGLESMVHGLTTALESSNPVQKSSLLHWILDWFKDHEPPSTLDLSNWAAPIVSSLDDRNGDVRKGSQALLPTLILCAGFDYVMQQTNSLKPASKASAIPLIQAARPTVTAATSMPPAPKPPTKPAIEPENPPSPPPESPTAPTKAAAPSKLTGVRRKLPPGTTSQPDSRAETPVEQTSRLPGKPATAPKRPGPVTTTPTPQLPPPSLPFISMNVEARKARLAKDGTRWINEGGSTRKDLAELLQHQMEPHASKELVTRLFSHDHNAVNDHIQGLTVMADLFSRAETNDEIEDVKSVCVANFDLPLKYASIKAHEAQPNLISKCLDVVEAVLGFLRSLNYHLTDAEALCFIPTMIYKVFHSSWLYYMF
jgi:cytoskeleton-associated protein 5